MDPREGYTGFIAQLNIPLQKPIIDDLNIACITDPIQLTANIPNGTWSASCMDCISSDGVFNPLNAGIGLHTIIYSKNCQSASIELMVCAPPFSSSLLSTGNDGFNYVLPAGSQDLNWQVSEESIDGPYNPAIVASDDNVPGGYSYSIWPDAQWISANADLMGNNGTYFYRVQFSMTAAEAQNSVINMQLMADNKVEGVYVNDQLVPNSATPTSAGDYGFQIQNAVSILLQGNWVEGLNTIMVRVKDEGEYSGLIAHLNSVESFSLQKPIDQPIATVSSIEVSPNPFTDATTLRIPNDLPGIHSAQVVITDLLGKVVYRNDDFPVNSSVSIGWEFKSSTTYIVKVYKSGVISSALIIKP